MHRLIEEKKPRVVVVDPISNLISVGTSLEVKAMLARLIDFMKVRQMTALFTSFPGAESGVTAVTATAQLHGWEGNVALVVWTDPTIRVDVLAGYPREPRAYSGG